MNNMIKKIIFEFVKAIGGLKYFPSVFCVLNDGTIDIITHGCIYYAMNTSHNYRFLDDGDGTEKINKLIGSDNEDYYCTSAIKSETAKKLNDRSKCIKYIYNETNFRTNKGNYEDYKVTDNYE